MTGFVKIYGSMLDSSIWLTDPVSKVVWITLLAMADADGYVEASVGGLAHRAVVSVEDCKRALVAFMSPDEDSKDPDNGGRRIEKVERGWRVLNYRKYRELQTEQQRKWAQKKRGQRGHVPHVPLEAEAEADTENGSTEGALHPGERAEKALKDEQQTFEGRLSALLEQLAWHENSRLTVGQWCRKVTSYKKGEKTVGGVSDWRGGRLSIERLEKSIADAEWWLGKLKNRGVVE